MSELGTTIELDEKQYFISIIRQLGEQMNDLNTYKPENDGNCPDTGIRDNSISVAGVVVSIIFRNQKEKLLRKIPEYNCIVGCVAWLTDYEILDALSKIARVAIVVQKEDFLRPDLNAGQDWKNKLRCAYNKLKPHGRRFAWPGLMGQLSVCGDDTIQAIRCMGDHNSNKAPAFPRMHNKFLVFSNFIEHNDQPKGYPATFVNCEVWTGSYNLTENAARSLENAVLIRSDSVAKAYYNEFCQIFALSEPLDWKSDWCAPEFRIGT